MHQTTPDTGAKRWRSARKTDERGVALMWPNLDFYQWELIKLGGLIVVGLIVLIHVVKLVKEAIIEIRRPLPK